jgi:anti-anti-sigma factor
MANAEALVNALRSAQEDVWLGSEVILDLSELSFIDSNGVRIIAEAARAMAPGRRLVIRSAPLSFLRIAQIFNLDRESGLILEGIE